MKIVMDRSKSSKKQNIKYTLKNRLISLYFDMNRICTRVKLSIYSLWVYTGSVLECSRWSNRDAKAKSLKSYQKFFETICSQKLHKIKELKIENKEQGNFFKRYTKVNFLKLILPITFKLWGICHYSPPQVKGQIIYSHPTPTNHCNYTIMGAVTAWGLQWERPDFALFSSTINVQ